MNFTANLGAWACSFLVRTEVANWDVSGGECKFIKFLNTPKHGTFIPTGDPGGFSFQPKSLGKDVVRFIVENTVSGRQAIVTLHITVAEPEANSGSETRVANGFQVNPQLISWAAFEMPGKGRSWRPNVEVTKLAATPFGPIPLWAGFAFGALGRVRRSAFAGWSLSFARPRNGSRSRGIGETRPL